MMIMMTVHKENTLSIHSFIQKSTQYPPSNKWWILNKQTEKTKVIKHFNSVFLLLLVKYRKWQKWKKTKTKKVEGHFGSKIMHAYNVWCVCLLWRMKKIYHSSSSSSTQVSFINKEIKKKNLTRNFVLLYFRYKPYRYIFINMKTRKVFFQKRIHYK